jgi:hypothetical protein
VWARLLEIPDLQATPVVSGVLVANSGWQHSIAKLAR